MVDQCGQNTVCVYIYICIHVHVAVCSNSAVADIL